MKTRAAYRPDQPLPLEPRAVPAALIASPTLFGLVDGTVTVRSSLRAPSVEHVVAQGTLRSLGTVKIRADLRPGRSGFAGQDLGGRMTIKDAGGTLTLRVLGTRIFNADTPLRLSYTIVGGTGRDRGARGTGVVELTEADHPLPRDPGTSVTRAAHLEFIPDPTVAPLPVALNGVLSGQVTQSTVGQDALGPALGVGTYAGRGPLVGAAGSFERNGSPIAPRGPVLLSDPSGTLTLLISPSSASPRSLRYQVVSGTGAYRSARGGGPASLVVGTISVEGPSGNGERTTRFPFLLTLGDGGGQGTVLPL